MHSLYGRGEPADWVTARRSSAAAQLLESIGDASVFVSLQAKPLGGQRRVLRQDVEELALLRRLVAVAGEISELGLLVPRT